MPSMLDAGFPHRWALYHLIIIAQWADAVEDEGEERVDNQAKNHREISRVVAG